MRPVISIFDSLPKAAVPLLVFGRRAVFLLLVFSAVFLPRPVDAESERSITGIVYDSITGSPVEDALVRVIGTAFATRTTASGCFELCSVPTGRWQVDVRRIGYFPSAPVLAEVVEGFERRIRIALSPSPVPLPAQQVEHTSVSLQRETGTRRYTSEQIARAGHRTLADALDAIPGVRVYGSSESPGGTRVSVGGASPERVAVLLDGLPLAIGANGAVNLDVIPLAAVASIEVTPGSQSAGVGDAAIGGAVNLRTRSDASEGQQRAEFSDGSFGTYRGVVTVAPAILQFIPHLTLEKYGRGSRFTYPDGDSTAVRQGVGINGWRGFLGLSPTTVQAWHVSAFVHRSKVGAPGALEQLYPGAANENTRVRAQGVWEHTTHPGSILGVSLWYESGDDRLRSTRPVPFNAEMRERFLGARLRGQRTILKAVGQLFAEFVSRRLEGRDYQRPNLAFGVRHRQEFALRGAARRTAGLGPCAMTLALSSALDGDNRFPPAYSPRIDLAGSLPFGLSVRSGWGRSFRRPLLTSLFWKADAFSVGNPDLRPERASEWDLAAVFRRWGITADSRYFVRHVRDIITWERDFMGRFQPRNVARAYVFGREDHLAVAAFRGAISADYSHVFTGAYDRSGELNHDGMVLVMTPRHTHELSLDASLGRWSGRVSGRWISAREILRQNNRNKQVRPYGVIDGFVRAAVRRRKPAMQAGLRVDNITNTRVDLLVRYPSPGRAWSAEMTVQF